MHTPKPWHLVVVPEAEEEDDQSEADFNRKRILINLEDVDEDWLSTPEALLAHEIAHTKIEKARPRSSQEADKGEYRARTYTYIKGWAGPKTTAELRRMHSVWLNYDRDLEYKSYKQAAYSLLRKHLISKAEYTNFLTELEDL